MTGIRIVCLFALQLMACEQSVDREPGPDAATDVAAQQDYCTTSCLAQAPLNYEQFAYCYEACVVSDAGVDAR